MYNDDCFIVNMVMQMMNVIQLQAHLREVRGSKCHVRPFQTIYSVVSLLENLQRYLSTPPGTEFLLLHGPGQCLRWQRDQWASLLFSDES